MLYVFFEYVRPQSIYSWMDIAPWSFYSLMGAVIFGLVEARFVFASRRLWLLFLVFSLIVGVSALTAVQPSVSWGEKDIWINWMLLVLVVGAGLSRKRDVFLFLLSFGLWNLKMTQHGVRSFLGAGLSFRASGVGGAPGWFRNSGEFGIEMCVFLPLAGYFAAAIWPSLSRRGRLIFLAVAASALISIVATSSRGALVGAAAVGLWLLLRSANRGKVLSILLISGLTVWLLIPAESKSRFTSMGDDQTSVSRITYWRHGIEIANAHPVVGIGYKNWLPYYRARYNSKGELPHNFLIECAAELGYVGLIALCALICAFFLENAKTRRSCNASSANPDRFIWSMAHGLDGAMIGFMVSGSFVSVLYYPYLWMNLALAMALANAVKDRSDSGRLFARLQSPRSADGMTRRSFAQAPGRP